MQRVLPTHLCKFIRWADKKVYCRYQNWQKSERSYWIKNDCTVDISVFHEYAMSLCTTTYICCSKSRAVPITLWRYDWLHGFENFQDMHYTLFKIWVGSATWALQRQRSMGNSVENQDYPPRYLADGTLEDISGCSTPKWAPCTCPQCSSNPVKTRLSPSAASQLEPSTWWLVRSFVYAQSNCEA